MSTQVLYVCTYWGVRSQIAKLLTQSSQQSDHEPDVVAASAGFESGKIGGLPREIMMERGLDLPADSPDTLFKFARKKERYDYVVTLCNQHTQENYSVLYNVVNNLFGESAQVIHWNIPDFMSIEATGDARKEAAEDIVNTIEVEVNRFIEQLKQPHAEHRGSYG